MHNIKQMLLLRASHQHLHPLVDGEIATREAIWVPEGDFTMESDAASEAATAESPFPGSSLGNDGSNINEQQIVIDPKRPVAITAYVLSPKPFHCVFIFVSRCLLLVGSCFATE